MRRSEKEAQFKQLKALHEGILNSNAVLLEQNQELDEIQQKEVQVKQAIYNETQSRDQKIQTFNNICEQLLDEKTIQKAITYGVKKGILDYSIISIPPNAKVDQLSIEQRTALIDVLSNQSASNSLRGFLERGVNFFDDVLDTIITRPEYQEELDNDN